MGAYLSEPVTSKHSSEDSSDTLVVGASSMQGWRVNQEDAHNTILSFDKGVQLFAVYDGHGGAEVATYCSQKLPDFIRQCDAYIKGDLEEALKQAFLDLDASLTKEEIIAELRKLAFPNESDAEDEDDNVANLREEASMPLEDVMAKYQSNAGAPAFKKLQAAMGKSPMSPCIRRGAAAGSGCTSSTDVSGPSSSGAGPSSSRAGSSSSASSAAEPENAGCSSGSPFKAEGSSSSISSSSVEVKDSASASESPSKPIKEETEDNKVIQTDASGTKVPQCESICKETSNGPSEEKNGKPQVNGDVGHSKEECAEIAEAVSSTTETSLKNGKHCETDEVKSKGKGKAKDKTKSISKDDDEENEERKSGRTRTTPIRKTSNMHNMKFLASEGELSDSEESEDDTSFEGKIESSDEEEDEDEEGEEEDDEEDEEDFEDTDSEDEGEMMKMNEFNEEPGSDSGCTAVVALLRGRDLFVANAGDSRCVVCRNGKAIDMSLDHKPEDAPEMARIKAAGGKVTCDGRVNGGLNLSRAIGDHAYKQGKDIPATQQMITAFPDVRTLRIDPKQDDFMILACDGIWNFMSSQDVVDFVRTRLHEQKLKPVQICEQLFDFCLSPNTMGDGTGCDNMTAVIVQFQPSLEKEPSTLERETILESPITNETLKKTDVEESADKEREEEEDCDEDKKKEAKEEDEKTEKGAKKRVVESNDPAEVVSPKQKKIKVDSDASEANGVEV